jgi:hypothetical protein
MYGYDCFPEYTVCDIPPAPNLNLNQTDNVNVVIVPQIKNHVLARRVCEKAEKISKIPRWKECVTIEELRPFPKQRIYCNCCRLMMDLFVVPPPDADQGSVRPKAQFLTLVEQIVFKWSSVVVFVQVPNDVMMVCMHALIYARKP